MYIRTSISDARHIFSLVSILINSHFLINFAPVADEIGSMRV